MERKDTEGTFEMSVKRRLSKETLENDASRLTSRGPRAIGLYLLNQFLFCFEITSERLRILEAANYKQDLPHQAEV